jgi:hypothetical protein
MDVANREDFLAYLDRDSSRNGLEVFEFSKRHLLAAVDDVGFDDFQGPDYEVMWRLERAIGQRDSEAALWGRVYIDLWHCRNFGDRHWYELVARDPAGIRYAIQAAYWVFVMSGADGGPALAALIDRCGCWDVARQYILRQAGDGLRSWWQGNVLPHRESIRG